MKNISMNAEMTKAILDGRKTQTRSAITRFDVLNIDDDWQTIEFNDKKIIEKGEDGEWGKMDIIDFISSHSKYQKDEVIRVREPAKIDICFTEDVYFHYLADSTASKISTPERFIKDGFVADCMAHCNGAPNGCIKEMARIFLKITDVRVERLQDIGANGIENEGYHISIAKKIGNCHEGMNDWWISLWNKTAPKGYKWEDNPDIFIHEFKRVNQDGSEL